MLRSIAIIVTIVSMCTLAAWAGFSFMVVTTKGNNEEKQQRLECFEKCRPYAISVIANRCFCNLNLKMPERGM